MCPSFLSDRGTQTAVRSSTLYCTANTASFYQSMSILTQDGAAEPRLARPKFSGTNAEREIFIFPVQLTACRTGNLTRLIHTLAICGTIQQQSLLLCILSRTTVLQFSTGNRRLVCGPLPASRRITKNVLLSQYGDFYDIYVHEKAKTKGKKSTITIITKSF